MTNVLDFFPFEEIRDSQVEALEWLAEQDAKYLLLEAPVGVGKSAIGLCFSRFLSQGNGSSIILTPQRILQEQYVRSFTDGTLASLYGKGNYSCDNRHTTCDVGSVIKPACPRCPFRDAVGRAKTSPNTVLNYKLGLLLFAFTEIFSKNIRSLMVLDECHTLEEHLTEFNAVQISQKRAEKFGVMQWPDTRRTNIFSAKEWMRQVYLPAASKYQGLLHSEVEPLLERSEYGDDTLTRAEILKIKEYSRLEEHVDSMTEFSLMDDAKLADKFVLIFDKASFKFKMLKGAENFHRIVKPHANRFLFMSSTILNKNGFCEDLNLPPDDTAFLSLGSEFPPDNRPVYYIPQMKMNKSWKDAERQGERMIMLDGLKKILSFHPDQNGIVHTGNFAIAEWLIENLEAWPQATHEFIHHNPSSGDERGAVINHFVASPRPSVLISPSITEGLDLVDDLARFAIIAKVPFGFLGDQWIKRREQISKEWYRRRALIDIIQGGGRVVRSKDDEGTVYILDESWGYLYSQTVNMIPGWWKEAYSRV